MKKILVLLLLAATTLGAQAKLGYSRTMINYTPLYLSSNAAGAETQTLYGGEISYTLGIKTYKSLFLEVGGAIQINGAVNGQFFQDLTSSSTTLGMLGDDFKNMGTIMCRLNIPVNLTYRFQFAKIFALSPYAGLNFGFNLYDYINGAQIGSVFGSSGDTLTDPYGLSYVYSANRFQMGWQVGVNFSVIGITVGVGYRGDFTSFDERSYVPAHSAMAQVLYGTDEVKRKTGSFVVGIGYGF